jgi:hypothetical protein
MIDGISQRMLTVTLRGLERDGLIARTVHPTVPSCSAPPSTATQSPTTRAADANQPTARAIV